MTVKVTLQETIEVTPKLLADAFTQMDNLEQCEFFEAMATLWSTMDFDTQMSFVGMQVDLSDEAREIMQVIGNHSKR